MRFSCGFVSQRSLLEMHASFLKNYMLENLKNNQNYCAEAVLLGDLELPYL
uniref:Uncharacterized protein n=1 Tax=Rhizophora mucronata TaxID=61149 RepID=A0A2P2M0P8_RHIMU